ncbi:MAG: hypothetical protein ILO68_00750 [Clostridia bacterium]|nr:hypothetical protein [Clostridia bacterium]
MFVILSGCSAVGKNTVMNILLNGKNSRYVLMPTYTTRAMRPGEREGFPYHYLTKDQFMEKISSGELYEYEFIHTNYYGSSRKLMAEAAATGKTILKDIDVKGALNLSRLLKGEMKVVTVFLFADKETLVQRLLNRGDRPEDIEIRLQRYDEEMSYLEQYDYAVEHLDLDATVRRVKDIIRIEKRKETLERKKNRVSGTEPDAR